jgi:Ca-activated chloride channel family protein
MRPKVRFQCLCLWLILGLASTDATAASFSARMTTTREGKTQTGTFFLQDQRYRMEVQENGHPVVVIADQAKNRHWIVNVMEANYFKIASDDFSVLSNDPFKTSDYIAAKYGIRSEGTETVAGFSCDRQQAQVQDTKVMTRWYASELDFPIKIIMHQGKQDAVVELTAIAQAPQKSELFIPPAGFKQVEEPGAAAKRKRREAEQQEAALAGLTAVGTGQVPCYVKVAAGGDLRVKLDSRRSAKVEVLNQIKEESRVNVLPFRNGQQVQNIGVAPWMLRGKGDQQNRDFNDSFAQNAKALLVDEVRIQVEQGLVYAAVSQKGFDRTDFYNRGHLQNGAATDPKKALAVQITGDNPFGPETTGKLLLIPQDGGASETVPFTVKTGQTASWKLASDRHIKGIRVIIKQGDGRAKITVDQTTATAAAAPTAAGAAATGAPAARPTRQPTRTVASAGGSTRQAPQTTASSDAAIPRMVLVLDASGSMWGQLQGEAKIAIAKKVMADLIATIPPSFQTGLTVYGHRRKGDCDDIEMIIPVGPHNAREMTAKVQAISPKGKTPLSAAVKQAAEALRYTEERATVVLVSDGLETCDIDPCELAAELAMSGVDFTVHVIGFDISVGDQERLRCLADKTGGLFLAADNAGSLRDALFKTVEKVQAPPPAVIEDPGTATLNGPASVPAGAAFQVTWQGPDSQRDYIAIAEKGSQDNRYRDYRYTLKGNPADFVAPGDVGDYELRYVHGHTRKVIGRTTVKVTPVQARVEVSPSADVATEIEVAWQGPAYKSDYISIARPDQGPGQYVNYTYTSKGSPLKVRAPSDPGTYEVRYILGRGSKLLAKTGIEIKAVGASVQGPPAADVATEFEVAWQGPNNKSDYISIARPDQGPGQYVNYTYTSKGSPLKVRAPSDPGTYEVRYILGRGSKLLAKTGIEIKAVGASVQGPPAADVATEFEVAWQGPNNKSDYISIARPDQGPGQYVNYTYTSKGSPLKVRAPSDPGTYEVRYILGRGSKLLAKTGIEINAVTASVQAPASADMATEFEVAWQGPNNKSDYISIARPDQGPGQYVNYTYTSKGSPLKVRAPSDPGTYEVRYILGRGSKLLAKTGITINAVTARVACPKTAAVDSAIQVKWQGPGHKGDYICISRPDQKPGRYVNYQYTGKGNPLTVKAPKAPGAYEIRYILGRGKKMLASVPITIE